MAFLFNIFGPGKSRPPSKVAVRFMGTNKLSLKIRAVIKTSDHLDLEVGEGGVAVLLLVSTEMRLTKEGLNLFDFTLGQRAADMRSGTLSANFHFLIIWFINGLLVGFPKFNIGFQP